jgi:uncharacterized protein with GYD domain
MPKYLVQGSYTGQGLTGILKDGGTSRLNAAKQILAEVGGTLEAFYFCFGADDFVLILDVPSNIDMTTIALTAQENGEIRSRVTVLLTPDEVDQAVKTKEFFRAPGQ